MSDLTVSGHRTVIEHDRCRIVCAECPWFKWDPDATKDELREMGWRHRDATKLR